MGARFKPELTAKEWKMIKAALYLTGDRISCSYNQEPEATDAMIDRAEKQAEPYYQLARRIPYKHKWL
jgi:hypothetical protein